MFKGKARMQNSKTYFSFFSRWYFTSGTCIDKDQSWRKMNLHKLAKKGEFCCNNGLCIDSENRCDNSIDCVDHSDEENCELVKFPTFKYKLDRPPDPETIKRFPTARKRHSTNVDVSV